MIFCQYRNSQKYLEVNSVINDFIESKQLKLIGEKCHRIHIRKKNGESDKWPVDNSGTLRKTIEERNNKAFAIVAEILGIPSEIPLGKY